MNTSILEQELAPLEAQIEQVRQKLETLKGELRAVEGELNTFSADKERFDTLRDVCDALDKLGEMEADGLFWEEIPEARDPSRQLEKVRARIASFEEENREILEKQRSLQGQIKQRLDDLYFLEEEVRDAYDREEQRKEEFVLEREMPAFPYRVALMPWAREAESERRLRRALLVALLVFLLFGSLIPLIKVPIPDRMAAAPEIPKRLVQLVKKDLPKPAPVPKTEPEPVLEQIEEQKKQAKSEPEPKIDEPRPQAEEPGSGERPEEKPTQVAANESGASAARKKAEGVGILRFKNAFKDLMTEAPVARLGTEAPLSSDSPQAEGQAVAQRSLVAIQAEGGSRVGIGSAGVSRNIGSGNASRLGGGGGYGTGGGGFVQAQSTISNLEESSRPTSDGMAPGRTDEEIQIVFDRYKAALYRIYNRELRKDPTLRGKVLMRMTIEPDGTVSMCEVESTDLGSPDLVSRIVERIGRFNFGPKEGVQKVTILYPIDFLPAG
ncbi:MAG: AgmX/PglI C-terminal domain-containing protein [bacterium]|nr:AgmX/PglI C-terminal domain-containing protein [bacterium]MDT8395260.1 AgmX/PglI C-terminal domain-containing protein [bacterium]